MKVRIEAPSSKSMTQRALIIAALADGPTRILRPLDCDDSRHLAGLLNVLGCRVAWSDETIELSPAPLSGRSQTIYCGNAGTAVRFGACLTLVTEGGFTLDGDPHMRSRPIGALGRALSALGVEVSYPCGEGYPPIALERRGSCPPEVTVDASLSSQYASGLLMVAPRLPHGLVLELAGESVSRPYLDMTVAMMRLAGAQVGRVGADRFEVAPGGYRAGEQAIEADWSGAAFLLAAAKLAGVDVEIPGLSPHSLQGDREFQPMLQALWSGRRDPLEIDLGDCPDLIAPLAAMAPFAPRPLRIRGAAHARVKECDRVHVLCRELAKLGAAVRELPDGLIVEPQPIVDRPVELEPDDDHRMAMAFGVMSLRLPGIRVASPECVSKSFPDFWDALARIRAAQAGD